MEGVIYTKDYIAKITEKYTTTMITNMQGVYIL